MLEPAPERQPGCNRRRPGGGGAESARILPIRLCVDDALTMFDDATHWVQYDVVATARSGDHS